jgi:serine/threonine-protein kinase
MSALAAKIAPSPAAYGSLVSEQSSANVRAAMQCPSCGATAGSDQKFCEVCGGALPFVATAPVDPTLVGQVIGGRYKVARLVGEGGMGSVYLAEQQLGTTVRRVALKTLHRHLSADPTLRTRFEREVATVAALEHPNTIQVFDFGTTPEGLLYIVMEFVEGKSLADVLVAERCLDPQRAIKILLQVCGSLAEAHKGGIVHRDLKPDNIMLTERAGQRDFVKVLDFGIAKRGGDEAEGKRLTQQGTVLGTPPYMSPEQFTGKPLDARSDLYSLAIMAYEMVSGELPFHADSPYEWATQHLTVAPRPLAQTARGPAIPLALQTAIERGMSKAPDQRYTDVEAFARALEGGAALPQTSPGTPIAREAARVGTESALPAPSAYAPASAMPGSGPPGYAQTPYPSGGYGPQTAVPISPHGYGPPPSPYGSGTAPGAAVANPYGSGTAAGAAVANPYGSGTAAGAAYGAPGTAPGVAIPYGAPQPYNAPGAGYAAPQPYAPAPGGGGRSNATGAILGAIAAVLVLMGVGSYFALRDTSSTTTTPPLNPTNATTTTAAPTEAATGTTPDSLGNLDGTKPATNTGTTGYVPPRPTGSASAVPSASASGGVIRPVPSSSLPAVSPQPTIPGIPPFTLPFPVPTNQPTTAPTTTPAPQPTVIAPQPGRTVNVAACNSARKYCGQDPRGLMCSVQTRTCVNSGGSVN